MNCAKCGKPVAAGAAARVVFSEGGSHDGSLDGERFLFEDALLGSADLFDEDCDLPVVLHAACFEATPRDARYWEAFAFNTK